MRKNYAPFLLLLAACCCQVFALAPPRKRNLPKPGWNLFSKQQDIEAGREFAKQVEQQFIVVQNKEITDYVNRVGMRLVEKGQLERYPFYFKVVQEDSINAFALPGGPMYVHTGLIKAADNEAQLAGVLAHELSHVVLRHGTNQASKAQFTQLGALLAGAVLGSGSLTGQLAQLGIGLGANSVLLKFSRGAESDADLLGAYTMARAGYNPIEMARFFEKLEAQSKGKTPKLVEVFTASHPNPGNRVKAIEDQLPYMPRSNYGASEGDLGRFKQIAAQLPPVSKPKPGQGSATARTPLPNAPKPNRVPVSSRMTVWRGAGLSISYPDNWEANPSQDGATIAPKEGLVQGNVGYGLMINLTRPGRRIQIDQDTQRLIQSLSSQNSNLRLAEQPQPITVGGAQARVARLSSDSPYANLRETDILITIDRADTLVWLVFVAPEPDYPSMEPLYQQIVRSIAFN